MSKQITISSEHYNEVISSALAWDALMSMIDPLLAEGYSILITRKEIPEHDTWAYQVNVSGTNHLAVGEGFPLTEALQDAYSGTPEVVR